MNDKTVRFPYRPRRPAPATPWITPFAWFLLGVFVALALGLWAP